MIPPPGAHTYADTHRMNNADLIVATLRANGITFGYPTLVWWTKDGKMEGCACRAQQSWSRVRHELGVN